MRAGDARVNTIATKDTTPISADSPTASVSISVGISAQLGIRQKPRKYSCTDTRYTKMIFRAER